MRRLLAWNRPDWISYVDWLASEEIQKLIDAGHLTIIDPDIYATVTEAFDDADQTYETADLIDDITDRVKAVLGLEDDDE